TTLNGSGCVNTATLNLTINSSSTTGSLTTSACDSYTWSATGLTYTASGVYTKTTLNGSGCVNTATLNLTINTSSTTGSLTTSACNSYTWSATGLTYTASGVYTKTTLNGSGCVNTATLNLTINSSTTTGSLTTSACDSYTWSATGLTYSASGVYTKTTLNPGGCVNTATLNLTINSSSTNGCITTSACPAYTWAANNQSYSVTGVYTYTSINAAGCVNTATLNLTIDPALCCNAVFNGLQFKDPTGVNTTVVPIVNGGTYSIGALPSPFNVEALWTGNMESVRFTLSGSASGTTVENYYTWDYGGTGSNWTHGPGTYTMLIEAFSQDNAAGTLCSSATVSFTLVTCSNLTSGGTIGSDESGCGSFNPSPITNITAPSGGSGTIEYVWLQSYDAGATYTVISGASNDNYDPGVITQTTWYRRCGRRSGCTNYDGESNWVKKELTLCAPTYPSCLTFSATNEFVQKVVFNTINNTSGNNGGYANFTAQNTTVVKGTTVPIVLTPGFTSSTYTEYWKVWIDWNYDGDWADAGEMVGSGTSTGTNTLTLNVAVPTTAIAGYALRMRVIMKRSAYASDPVSPSGTLRGEVEDYSVTVATAGARMNAAAQNITVQEDQELISSVLVYPNPITTGDNFLNLSFDMVEQGKVNFTVVAMDGRRISRQEYDGQRGQNSTRFDISNLASGNYHLVIEYKGVRQTHKFVVH
ncbi:MAG TPA: GEVED domain-containing protein, partial [Chitinophagaceae bacterium]|nr:GEVED domain-containing protein [Chitinophagaceae bacterium]